MARPNKLYIFATSDRPDPYVNIIMHWLGSSGSISEITFVCVHEHDYPGMDPQAHATTVLASVQRLLNSLAGGSYTPGGAAPPIAIPADQAARYRDCLDKLRYVRLSGLGVRWSELATRTTAFRQGGRSAFDVTAFKNHLLVDAVALLLSEGEGNISSFELLRAPTYGPGDLMAALTSLEYIYRSLTDSPHVDVAMRRMVARSATFRLVVWVTVAIAVPVILIQVFWPTSWLQSVLVALGAAVSLASWFFALKQRA